MSASTTSQMGRTDPIQARIIEIKPDGTHQGYGRPCSEPEGSLETSMVELAVVCHTNYPLLLIIRYALHFVGVGKVLFINFLTRI